jgi:spermidine synthase
MLDMLPDRDTLIYREMLTHIPLFAHRDPKTVAILDENNRGLLQEVLKHPTVTTVWQIGALENASDARVKNVNGTLNDFLLKAEKNSLNILMIGSTMQADFNHCINALHEDGILIQLCESSFDLATLKNTQNRLKAAEFSDILPLNFPQPHFASGWRAAIIATKSDILKRPREKDIFNKTFSTGYYNLDMHKAAFALPEFMREELIHG